MPTFVAHYRSANASASRSKGSFDFESDSRLGSKANMSDARVRMLELYGNEALSWSIDHIERKGAAKSKKTCAGQLELDFREPISKPTRTRRRSTKRGVL